MYTLLLIIFTTTGTVTSVEIEDMGNFVQCGQEKNIQVKALNKDRDIYKVIGRCVRTRG